MNQFWALFSTIFLVFTLASVPEGSSSETDAQNFIVRIQNNLKPSVFSDVEQWYTATLRSLDSTPLEIEEPKISQTRKPQEFLHVYKTVFHGFSARLTLEKAQELKNRPGVLAVLPDKLRQLQTTRSPEFLGILSNSPAGLLKESDSGSNVVIGILDTGIWPERRSFHDEDLGPVPDHWKGGCSEGKKFTKNLCNKKVIGARFFAAGYEATYGRTNQSIDIRSPRDTDGHGTHTASTAAGRAISNASLLGFATGVAVGIAPKARIAAYKICWKSGCMESDILAAFDKAVQDGVNIISISVGGGTATYNLDPIAIGAFGAMEKGVFVSASAGNAGPNKYTVTNVAPWITSVGASTIDRKFPANLVLKDGRVLKGASIYHGHRLLERTYVPLIYGGNASIDLSHGSGHFGSFSAATCMPGSLDKEKVQGKIVVCDRGGSPRVAKGEVVRLAGGLGVIVANVAPLGEGLVADAHIIPGLSLGESDGNTVRAYINSNPYPKARMVFRGTEVGVKPAPVVASFSARGPNAESVYVLKPDVLAPGVNILAAWPDGVPPTELSSDTRRIEFNIASGTSMSCPHVSGIAALLKGAHPDWSPAMIRSALMTTASMHDHEGKTLLDETSYQESTVWDTGAGHVNPEKALDPGLVYDLSENDYVNFLCASKYSRGAIREVTRNVAKCKNQQNNMPWDLNYPAIVVVFDKSGMTNFDLTVKRTVTHVGEGASSYSVSVTNPKGATITVNPSKMDFSVRRQKQSYVVQIKGDKLEVTPGKSVSEWGMVTWADGKHQVGSPVVVVWRDVF